MTCPFVHGRDLAFMNLSPNWHLLYKTRPKTEFSKSPLKLIFFAVSRPFCSHNKEHGALFPLSLHFQYLSRTMAINCDLQQCMTMNNHAVEQFELGCFHQSLGTLTTVLDSLSNLMPRSRRGQCNPALSKAPKTTVHQLRRWSRPCNFQTKGKDDVFVHCRAIFLTSPDSFDASLYDYYATLILYNIALCYHALSIHEADSVPSHCYSEKAFSLYNMAFATMKESMYKDSALATVLFNNSGHVLYGQGRTFEATKCLRLVQDLMWSLPVNSLAPDDLHGMYLNSLMICNTASAA